jgi:hypothetical protein
MRVSDEMWNNREKIIMVKETGSWFSTINHKLNMKREA